MRGSVDESPLPHRGWFGKCRPFNNRKENYRAGGEFPNEDASGVFVQFFTMEISVSELRTPVFMFIHGLCRAMLTPFNLNIAPLSPV